MYNIHKLGYVFLFLFSIFLQALEHSWLSQDPGPHLTYGENISCPPLSAPAPSPMDSTPAAHVGRPQRKPSYDRTRLNGFVNAKSRWTKCANMMKACNELSSSSQH